MTAAVVWIVESCIALALFTAATAFLGYMWGMLLDGWEELTSATRLLSRRGRWCVLFAAVGFALGIVGTIAVAVEDLS